MSFPWIVTLLRHFILRSGCNWKFPKEVFYHALQHEKKFVSGNATKERNHLRIFSCRVITSLALYVVSGLLYSLKDFSCQQFLLVIHVLLVTFSQYSVVKKHQVCRPRRPGLWTKMTNPSFGIMETWLFCHLPADRELLFCWLNCESRIYKCCIEVCGDGAGGRAQCVKLFNKKWCSVV
jgi:hypothetical protein